jgi:hypothetical protein
MPEPRKPTTTPKLSEKPKSARSDYWAIWLHLFRKGTNKVGKKNQAYVYQLS